MNPTFYKFLPNGLRIVHRTTPSDVIYAGVMIGAGTRHESPEHNGLAHYIEHCVFKGTQHLSARAIINKVENVGGEINAYTTKEETTYYAAVPSAHLRQTLHLLHDMVTCPTFPRREVDKEIGVILDEIDSYEDSPSELIYDDFEGLIFADSPLSMPILGTKKTLRTINRHTDIASQWIQRNYTPDRMVIFAEGNIAAETVFRMVAHIWSDAPSSPAREAQVLTPRSDFHLSPSRLLSYKRHTHQTHLMIGGLAYPLGHQRQLGLYLLNNILGGGAMSSRLNLRLREQKGLVYTIESQYTPLSDTGYWSIYFASEPQHREQCMALIRDELDRLRTTPLSSSQFARALTQLRGQMAISDENRENRTLAMAKLMLYYNHAPLWQDTFARIEQITPALLQDIAQEVYNEQGLCTLIYE